MSSPSSAPLTIFGEILWDCFPDGTQVLGGAPFNVAWHLQAFGQHPRLISCIGTDTLGAEIQAALQDWGMDLSGIQRDPEHPTGRVAVSFSAEGEPHYHISPDSAWDFIRPEALPAAPSGVLYHGSLALRQPVSAQAWHQLCARASQRFVDLNLRPPWWQSTQVRGLLAGARWLKLNADELTALQPELLDLPSRARRLLADKHLEWVVVTQGAAGASAFMVRGEQWTVTPQFTTKVVDTVGAGDAFSSVLLLGLQRGWPLQQTLPRAQQFASAIVGLRGAITQERAFYQHFVRAWGL